MIFALCWLWLVGLIPSAIALIERNENKRPDDLDVFGVLLLMGRVFWWPVTIPAIIAHDIYDDLRKG